MKTSNTIATGTQMINSLNGVIVNAPVVLANASFSTADLWSIQRNRRVRSVRKVMFN